MIRAAVGSYGTRNIVVIGLEPQNDCIDDLSKFYSSGDPPFRGGGGSPSPVFTAVLEKSHVRHGANRRCLQSNSCSESAGWLCTYTRCCARFARDTLETHWRHSLTVTRKLFAVNACCLMRAYFALCRLKLLLTNMLCCNDVCASGQSP
jgi:hypothetical protein